MVMDCKTHGDEFDPEYKGWTVLVSDKIHPTVTFRNLGVEGDCFFEEFPKELEEFLEEKLPKGTYKSFYNSGVYIVAVDIHMVFVEWLFKALK
jgi:hypothetical protein